jgi:hypothetical protein
VSEDLILERLRRLESQVELLSQRLGIPYDDGTSGIPHEVVELVRADKRIQAVKRYQELAGCDLATARDVVGRIL